MSQISGRCRIRERGSASFIFLHLWKLHYVVHSHSPSFSVPVPGSITRAIHAAWPCKSHSLSRRGLCPVSDKIVFGIPQLNLLVSSVMTLETFSRTSHFMYDSSHFIYDSSHFNHHPNSDWQLTSQVTLHTGNSLGFFALFCFHVFCWFRFFVFKLWHR